MSKSREAKRQGLLTKAIKARKESGLVLGELLSIDEASEYIHLGQVNIRDCIKKNLIRSFQPSVGVILLDSVDLDNWLRASEIPAGTVKEAL